MLAIDHLVIAAKNPEQAANDFQRKHHVTVIPGGRHEKWGTYNYLAYLANDCYIEWIGIFDEDRARKSTNPLIQQLIRRLTEKNEGLFQLAFRTMNMNLFVDHFNEENIPYKGPIPGSRMRPDSTTLAWKMLFPHPNADNELYPFLIEWDDGINKPDQKQDMSDLPLKSIAIPHKMVRNWTGVYHIHSKGHKIDLTNSEIHFSQNDDLEFMLGVK